MIEKVILDYLEGKLESSVLMETPEEPQETYILIEKTGGSEENLVSSATIALQSIASSLLRAAQLNKKVVNAMKGIIELDSIGSVKLNSDYNFTDAATKKYRYQAVFEIKYYG